PPSSELHSFPTRRSSDLTTQSSRAAVRTSRTRTRPAAASVRYVDVRVPSPRAPHALLALRPLVFIDYSLAEGVIGLVKNSGRLRSEEHTSELQSPDHLVC